MTNPFHHTLDDPRPQEKITRHGFRPHPGLLTIARWLHPSMRSHTALFMSIIQGALTSPKADPVTLGEIHAKVLLLEKSHPFRSRTSKGHMELPSYRYPLISLYLDSSHREILRQYTRTFPEFTTLQWMFRHALFTLLLQRRISLQEIERLFGETTISSSRRTNPFLNSLVRETPKQDEQLPLDTDTQEDDAPHIEAPTPEEVLSALEMFLTPELEVPTEEQLTTLRDHLKPGRSHPIFPITSWDYRPILERALLMSKGLLSSDLLRTIGAPLSQ